MRQCSFCNSEILHVSGFDESAGDRGGNAKEVDEFDCVGCKRRYCHVYYERFSGDTEYWDVKTDSGWDTLARDCWPVFIKVHIEESCDYVGRTFLDKQLDQSQDWWSRIWRSLLRFPFFVSGKGGSL